MPYLITFKFSILIFNCIINLCHTVLFQLHALRYRGLELWNMEMPSFSYCRLSCDGSFHEGECQGSVALPAVWIEKCYSQLAWKKIIACDQKELVFLCVGSVHSLGKQILHCLHMMKAAVIFPGRQILYFLLDVSHCKKQWTPVNFQIFSQTLTNNCSWKSLQIRRILGGLFSWQYIIFYAF